MKLNWTLQGREYQQNNHLCWRCAYFFWNHTILCNVHLLVRGTLVKIGRLIGIGGTVTQTPLGRGNVKMNLNCGQGGGEENSCFVISLCADTFSFTLCITWRSKVNRKLVCAAYGNSILCHKAISTTPTILLARTDWMMMMMWS